MFLPTCRTISLHSSCVHRQTCQHIPKLANLHRPTAVAHEIFFFFQALNFLVESCGLLNDLFPLPSILDEGYPIFYLHLADVLLAHGIGIAEMTADDSLTLPRLFKFWLRLVQMTKIIVFECLARKNVPSQQVRWYAEEFLQLRDLRLSKVPKTVSD